MITARKTTPFEISPSLLQILRCPLHLDGGTLKMVPAEDETEAGSPSGLLQCRRCDREFPVIEGIPNMLIDGDQAGTFREREMHQWDDQARRYDAKRLSDLIYMAGVEAVVQKIRPEEGDFILDAGCGTGLTIKRYYRPGLRVVALDLSRESLKYLRQTLGQPVDCVQGDLTALPFADGVFGKVVCANAITQVPEAEQRHRCVVELARVARPQARLIISAHNYSKPKKRAGWPPEGTARSSSGSVQYIYRFEPTEFQALLSQSWHVETIRGAGLPFPYKWKLTWLSRRLERLARRFRMSADWGNMVVAAGCKV